MADAHQDFVSELDRTNREGFLDALDRLVRQMYGMGASPIVEQILAPHLGDKEAERGWLVHEHEAKIEEKLPIDDVPVSVIVEALRAAVTEAHDEVELHLCQLVTRRIVADDFMAMQTAAAALGRPTSLVWLMSRWLREEMIQQIQLDVVPDPEGFLGSLFGGRVGMVHTPTKASAYAFVSRAGFLCLPEPLETTVRSNGRVLTVTATRLVKIYLDPMLAVRVAYAPGS